MVATTSLICPKNERQWNFNNVWPCTMENAMAGWHHLAIFELSAAILGENDCDNIATISSNGASTERQRLLALHLGQ